MDATMGKKEYIERQTKMSCLQNRALKKSILDHLMKQLEISTKLQNTWYTWFKDLVSQQNSIFM